jgi:hypothetical protein
MNTRTKTRQVRRDRGATLPTQWQRKHGARGLARYLAANQIDGRTWIGRALTTLRTELAADAGGFEHLTVREQLLVDRTAACALILQSIEAWVLAQPAPIVNGELLGVLRKGYVSHLAQFTRCLQALGLRPDKLDKALDLPTYIAEYDRKRAAAAAAPAAPVTEGETVPPGEEPTPTT